MEDPKNDLRRLGSTKRAQVLIPGPIDAVTVHVDTYLTVPEKFELRARNPRVGFTRAELVISITGMYQYVYRVEEETMGMGEAPYVSLNRGYTLGKYQIYGHSLGDLILHTAYYNPEKRSMTLGMDS